MVGWRMTLRRRTLDAWRPICTTSIRRDLREVRVAVFVIRTVREQMRYDTPRLVVEAGKPFEVKPTGSASPVPTTSRHQPEAGSSLR